MELLSRVEKFRNLTIIGGAVPLDVPSHPLLTVDHLRITPNVDAGDYSHAWMSVVKLDRVSSLSFSASPRTQTVLTLDRVKSMHSLRTLNISIKRSSISYLLSVLAALPLLLTLNLVLGGDPDSDDQNTSDKVTITYLDHYSGPLSILLRLHLPNLNNLDITGVSGATPAEPNALIQLLPYIQDTLRTVKRLAFMVLFLTEPLCKMVLLLLPPESQIECLQFFIFNPLPTARPEHPAVDSLEVFHLIFVCHNCRVR
jgi:hypothetical protein